MSVRTEGAELLGDETTELPTPAALVAALAERLLRDSGFHDEVLAWFAAHLEDETDAAGEG
jgi:hypothetical protein